MATLITKAQHAKLLKNGLAVRYGDVEGGDLKPVVKLFTPDADCTWLLSELDPDDHDTAFGLADLGLGHPELGWVWLPEVRNLRGKLGLPVERDQHFEARATMDDYADVARTLGHYAEEWEAKKHG